LLPVSIDKQAVSEDHPAIFCKHPAWIQGLEEWFRSPPNATGEKLVARVGPWKRSAYNSFDIESAAYQDMVFFHPFVRRVFFDSAEKNSKVTENKSLLQCYWIDTNSHGRLWFLAEDAKQRRAKIRITDLRLFVFANGIAILSIGVETAGISVRDGLWVNEMMRKIYPSSSRQLREGRVPTLLALIWEPDGGSEEVLAEERFEGMAMDGFLPPMARTVQALLYFCDYERQEYEPVLDERMIVYTYATIDPSSVPAGFAQSTAYEVLLSRLLYVDRAGEDFRYDPTFVAEEMSRQVYRRWAHQGTYYGFTSYSNVTSAIGSFNCDEHELREGFLIHRMFTTRYYLMALATLFYRATLLDFAERTALVARQLHLDQYNARISTDNIRLASELRSDFLHFSNYWYFDELANKDEENEHFLMQVREYRIDVMKEEVEEEVDKLNASLHHYYQFRSTEAVNRLAMLSLILGAGAVVTGFFGMNFGGAFGKILFEPAPQTYLVHLLSMLFVTVFAAATLSFGLYVVAAHWTDYRESLLPKWWLARKRTQVRSLRRS
jgi:hypothetical protein